MTSKDLLSKSEVRPGEILLNMSGSVGNSAVASEYWEYPINSNQDIAKIVPNKDTSPYYLSAFLNSKYGRFQTQRLPVGSIQQHIFLWQIELVTVPLLGELEEAVSNLGKTAEVNMALAYRRYNEAEKIFLDVTGLSSWEATHALTYAGRYCDVERQLRCDAEHFQPKYSSRRQIRDNKYGYCRLTDVASISQDVVNPRDAPEKEFDYVELADINDSIGVVDNTSKVQGETAPSRARMLLKEGDVIASSVEGSLNKVAIIPPKHEASVGSTGFFVFRPMKPEKGYVLVLVKSNPVQQQMHCETSGTILSSVKSRALRNIIVPDVPRDERQNIDRCVAEAHEAYRTAKLLFKKGRRCIEIAIEKDMPTAAAYLDLDC